MKRQENQNPVSDQLTPGELTRLLPPHFAVLCNEDPAQFNQLFQDLLAVYQPLNTSAFFIVRDIVVARWLILRLDNCLTNHWNLAILENAARPLTVAPEISELQIMSRATEALFTGSGFIRHTARLTDQLTRRVDRLERQLERNRRHFPTRVIEPNPAQPETTPEPNVDATTETDAEQPVFVTEASPSVIAYYRQFFPGRRIVVLPADDVARGIDVEDDMPDIPRKAA